MSRDEDAPYSAQARTLSRLDWPVLEASASTFDDPDALATRPLRELAQYAERDPGLALRLIQQANGSRRGLRHEVHALADAIGMLGLQGVHRIVREAPRVADAVRRAQAYRDLAAQSRLAALIAVEVAGLRHDSEPGEVALAALLNQLGFLALLIADEPRLDRLLVMLELNALPDEASYVALGYATDDLSRAMTEQMALPELLTGTQRAVNAMHPRALEVMASSALAWQILRGMDTARGDRDLQLLARLAGQNEKVLVDRLDGVIERFNQDAAVYRRSPLERGIPGRVWIGAPRHQTPLGLLPRQDILDEGLAALRAEVDPVRRIRRMLRVMQFGLGLNRVVFARLARDGESLRAEYLVGTLHEPEFSHFTIPVAALGPLAGTLQSGQPQWWGRDVPLADLPAEVRQLTGGVAGFVGRVADGEQVLGMVYADRRTPDLELTPVAFAGFAQVLEAASRPSGG
ncbi:HDOD domain-containing protein [Thioalkalivibrio sp. ALJT]|uniref:HDOD domain-containing protein n=1 Tax=Thioalkalivibrio sp. ALJT TaxID=1158146 RepID=UPI000379FDA2|nr:HDOD domain-containing protein [Thioalkalivibrio sp. ALJT]